MRRIISIFLAISILIVPLYSYALSWADPTVSAEARPFSIEVIALRKVEVSDSSYYNIVPDGSEIPYSDSAYYAIKARVPSCDQVNAYYGTKLQNTDSIDATISYENLEDSRGTSVKQATRMTVMPMISWGEPIHDPIGSSFENTVSITMSDGAQTLWYDGTEFSPVPSSELNNSIGCDSDHILQSKIIDPTKRIYIRAKISAESSISQIAVDGCYKILKLNNEAIASYGNHSAENINGYAFYGDCSFYGAVFSTDSSGKVTDAYSAECDSSGVRKIYQQTDSETIRAEGNRMQIMVNCMNHIYSLLGFTYADILANQIHMDDNTLLENYGPRVSSTESRAYFSVQPPVQPYITLNPTTWKSGTDHLFAQIIVNIDAVPQIRSHNIDSICIDGIPLAVKNQYHIREGSRFILSLLPSCLNSLSIGKHKLTVSIKDGMFDGMSLSADIIITSESSSNEQSTGNQQSTGNEQDGETESQPRQYLSKDNMLNGSFLDDGSLTFGIDAPFNRFTGSVFVDNNLLEHDDFSAKDGSTIIILSPSYLEALSHGDHTLLVEFSDGFFRTTFHKGAQVAYVPATGNGIIMPTIFICLAAFLLLICLSGKWRQDGSPVGAQQLHFLTMLRRRP